MKDHEIIAQIETLLDGAAPDQRARVEAWLRAKVQAPVAAQPAVPASQPWAPLPTYQPPVIFPVPMPAPRDPWRPPYEITCGGTGVALLSAGAVLGVVHNTPGPSLRIEVDDFTPSRALVAFGGASAGHLC